MQSKLDQAAKEFKKLPQREQDLLDRRWKAIHDSYTVGERICNHCGSKVGKRVQCLSCYGEYNAR